MRLRVARFLLPAIGAAISLAACKPPAPMGVNGNPPNGGVDILPPAVLASQKIEPSQDPAPVDGDTLVQVLVRSRRNHEVLLRAIRVSGMIPELQTAGPYTLLAPTDQAFAKLAPGTMELLYEPKNIAVLRSFVRYHILPGRLSFKDLVDTDGSVTTLNGQTVVIKGIDHKVLVNDANVVESDSSANNGNIHWLDSVLLPPLQ